MQQLYFVLLLLNIIAVNGTNEVASISLGMILLVLLVTHKKINRKLYIIVGLAAIIYLVTIAISGFAPGNKERLESFATKNYFVAVGSIFIRITYIFWNIFQSPLFWIASIGNYFIAIKASGHITIKKRGKLSKEIFLYLLVS